MNKLKDLEVISEEVSKYSGIKWCLVHIGNDLTYGLTFVAGELLRMNHEIMWIDGDEEIKVLNKKIKDYAPDYVCFGPLSTEFNRSLELVDEFKKVLPSVKSVFGGKHVLAIKEEVSKNKNIDYSIWGPVYGTIDKIIESPPQTFIKGAPVTPREMNPSYREYFEQVPRMGNRERKYVMSHFGCVYNCSFCCTSVTRKSYGAKAYKEYYLTRRPVENIIEEAKLFLEFPTKEVCLADDDVLLGTHKGAGGTQWLGEFAKAWKKEINLPMYANVTPNTVAKATDESMEILSSLMRTVQMGVQTTEGDSSRLFNRHFQDENQVIEAVKRITAFGVKVKLETIIGLPNIDGLVPDPVKDAVETVKMAQRITREVPSGMTFTACFPLMLYPGTSLWEKSEKAGIPLSDACEFEWHSGEGSVRFDPLIMRRIKNMSKMATGFIKYDMNEQWMRALIDVDLNDSSLKQLSECQYLESLKFRLGGKVENEFDEILGGMHFKY